MKITDYSDIKVTMLYATPNPTYIIRLAVDMTQKRNISRSYEKPASEKLCKSLVTMNHGSLLEHINYTFLIEGASRSFLAQITRHRMASYTSGSQHYQDYSDFEASMDKSMKDNKLVYDAIEYINDTYKMLIEQGIPIYEARQILPNGAKNNLLFTINARSLLNFINLRTCRRNTREIAVVTAKILVMVREHFPELFNIAGPDCWMKGSCSQGKMSCKQPIIEKITPDIY